MGSSELNCAMGPMGRRGKLRVDVLETTRYNIYILDYYGIYIYIYIYGILWIYYYCIYGSIFLLDLCRLHFNCRNHVGYPEDCEFARLSVLKLV